MYIRLSENRTKKRFVQILTDTISLFDSLLRSEIQTDIIDLYQNIYDQLIDIKENVVDYPKYSGWEQICGRYTLGAIASKNYDDDDEIKHRLCDIFGGAVHFDELKDE